MIYIQNKETAEKLNALGFSYMLAPVNGKTMYVFDESEIEDFDAAFTYSKSEDETYFTSDKLLF